MSSSLLSLSLLFSPLLISSPLFFSLSLFLFLFSPFSFLCSISLSSLTCDRCSGVSLRAPPLYLFLCPLSLSLSPHPRRQCDRKPDIHCTVPRYMCSLAALPAAEDTVQREGQGSGRLRTGGSALTKCAAAVDLLITTRATLSWAIHTHTQSIHTRTHTSCPSHILTQARTHTHH